MYQKVHSPVYLKLVSCHRHIEYDLKNKYPHYLIDLLDNTSIFFSNHTPYVCDMVQVLTRQVNELFDAQNCARGNNKVV